MKSRDNVKHACEKILLARISELKQAENSAKESAATETKSSAGDKHETARELIHQERELVSRQINEAENQLAELNAIQERKLNNSISKGCVIYTTIGYFFLGISLGFIAVGDLRIACISTSSPIGNLLLGKKLNERFQFQGREIKILEID
jgi:transcription elongation GreA/GreB family factor